MIFSRVKSPFKPHDQAFVLRQRVQASRNRNLISKKNAPPILAFAGAKGGVGKSALCINMACQFAKRGKKILLFDSDFGLGNTDILLGITPEFSVTDILDHKISLAQAIVSISSNISLLAAGSGHFKTAQASPANLEGLCIEIEQFASEFDYVFVDTGSGIQENTLTPVRFADEIILITTPEPTAITDTYATLKYIYQSDPSRRVHLLVNMADSQREAYHTYEKINFVAQKYLGKQTEYLGGIVRDSRVSDAVCKQRPFLEVYPSTKASLNISEYADQLLARFELPTEIMPSNARRLLQFWKSETVAVS